MKSFCVLLLLLGSGAGTLMAEAAEPPPVSQVSAATKASPVMTPAEFASEMLRLSMQAAELETNPQKGPEFAARLPKQWIVEANGSRMEVTTDPVRNGVESFLKAEPKAKPGALKSLEERLRRMQNQAAAYDAATQLHNGLHPQLEQILDAREFRQMPGPSALQLLWQRILNYVEKQFNELSPHMPSASEAGPVFAWCVIAMVCAALGVWLYRRSRQQDLIPVRDVIPFAPGAKGWSGWLADARAAAAAAAWRAAIHLAFWAGVRKLESEGTWLPDRARTPREYLRAIPEWNTSRPAFDLLTRSLERCWYGGRPASQDDYTQILSALEKLGCR